MTQTRPLSAVNAFNTQQHSMTVKVDEIGCGRSKSSELIDYLLSRATKRVCRVFTIHRYRVHSCGGNPSVK